MKNLDEKTIGEIVADNYRTASVFKEYNIDFCCKGNRTIEQVSEKKNINVDELRKKIDNAYSQARNTDIDFKTWDLDLLADYIEKTHHRYIESRTPELKAYLHKIYKVHGINHPELEDIYRIFDESAGDLAAHMKKEELVLFPFIKKMVRNNLSNSITEKPHFGTVENPISMMKQEHDVEGERFREIAALSNNYTPPADACNTYRVAFALLKEFENDLHKHIHLENNILFPKAIEMEAELTQ